MSSGTEPGTPSGSVRFRARMRRGLIVGAVAGGVIGVICGAIVAAAVSVSWGVRAGGALLACTFAGIALGLFWGGFSRLESPRPTTEPSEVERPIRDEPGSTKDERTGRIPRRPR